MKYARFAWDGEPMAHEVQITVFPSRRAFLTYLRAKECDGERITGAGCAGKMLGFPLAQVGRDADPLAEIVAYEDTCTVDTIAHEAFHALVYVFRIAGRPVADTVEDEELFAGLLGKLTNDIFRWRETPDGQ